MLRPILPSSKKWKAKVRPAKLRSRSKGDRIRMEAPPQTTMIVDGKTRRHDHAHKRPEEVHSHLGRNDESNRRNGGEIRSEQPSKNRSLPSTGKKTTINGYEAEEYVGETVHVQSELLDRPEVSRFRRDPETASSRHANSVERSRERDARLSRSAGVSAQDPRQGWARRKSPAPSRR